MINSFLSPSFISAIKAARKRESKKHNINYKTPETPSHIIIDCSMFSHIDTNGVTTLKKTVQLYKEVGVITFLAGCPVHITKMLEKDGFFIDVPFSHSYISIHDAVTNILEEINANKHHETQINVDNEIIDDDIISYKNKVNQIDS